MALKKRHTLGQDFNVAITTPLAPEPSNYLS